MKTSRTLGLIALAAAALVACETPEGGDMAGGSEGVLTMPESGSPFIAFNIWVKAGSQNDPAGKEGLAALTANLLADASTRTHSYQEIIELLYPMAAGYGSSVDKEMTVFRGVVHRDNLDAYYGLFKDALLAPGWLPEDFDRVKSQTMNFLERGRRFNRDEELSRELLSWMLYQGTPYEHPEEGYVQSVASITLQDVQDFYSTYYTADNLVVGVGGGYPSGFAEQVRTDFDDALPAGAPAVVPPPPPSPVDGVKVLIVEKQTDASAISFGFRYDLVRGDTPDFWSMMMVNSWFGEHRSSFSHLYQVIREERGMNYGDYSYIEPFPASYTTQEKPVNASRRSNFFEIWIRPISLTAPDNLHDRTLFATRAAWRELDMLVESGLPQDQIDRTRQYLHNISVTYGSTVSRRLSFAVDDQFFGFPAPGYLASIRDGLAGLDKATVDAALRRYLQAGNMVLVLITADAEGMKQKLLSGEVTLIDYTAEQPPELLAEDQEIGSFPIPVEEGDIMILDIMEVFEGG